MPYWRAASGRGNIGGARSHDHERRREKPAEADACHDADPPRAAALLAVIDAAALEAGERPLYAFLLNHVLGEKLGDWAQAQHRQDAMLAAAGEAAPPVLWRQAAVAATLAGEAGAARQAIAGLARAAGVTDLQAQELVQLAAAGFQVPRCDAEAAAALAMQALRALDAPHWHTASVLDTPAAASCNNLAAHLSERPVARASIGRVARGHAARRTVQPAPVAARRRLGEPRTRLLRRGGGGRRRG